MKKMSGDEVAQFWDGNADRRAADVRAGWDASVARLEWPHGSADDSALGGAGLPGPDVPRSLYSGSIRCFFGSGRTDPRTPWREGSTGTRNVRGKEEEKQGSITLSRKLERIAKLAREVPQAALTTRAHHIDIDWLREAYRRARTVRDIVRKRLRDGVLLRLIGKWLNAGVMEDGAIEYPEAPPNTCGRGSSASVESLYTQSQQRCAPRPAP
jgi:hypothetical protein